ncbi:MAG: hypothetical protein Q9220_007744 [cf. Caloplaca sp. 1 TL-2023]
MKDTGGASTEYQHVIIELNGLENVLRQLEALKPNENNVNQVNAIRGMALACQIPLREFLSKLERYDASMNLFLSRTSIKAVGHKARWALCMSEDVTKLRALIAAKVLSINLMLAVLTSYAERVAGDNLTATDDDELLSQLQDLEIIATTLSAIAMPINDHGRTSSIRVMKQFPAIKIDCSDLRMLHGMEFPDLDTFHNVHYPQMPPVFCNKSDPDLFPTTALPSSKNRIVNQPDLLARTWNKPLAKTLASTLFTSGGQEVPGQSTRATFLLIRKQRRSRPCLMDTKPEVSV